MTRQELQELVVAYKSQTRDAVETILAELNHGQKKKVLRNEAVKALCERFSVEVDE